MNCTAADGLPKVCVSIFEVIAYADGLRIIILRLLAATSTPAKYARNCWSPVVLVLYVYHHNRTPPLYLKGSPSVARGDGGEFNVRVRQEQADEFFARVSRGAHDGYWFGIHHKKTPPD